MLPKSQQWRKWSLPSKYSLVGIILSIVGIALSIVFWVVPLLDISMTNEDWYIGTWKVDLDKSAPEFDKQYAHFRSVFGQEVVDLWSWLDRGESMEDAVFIFGKSAGQMIKDGEYKIFKGSVRDLEVPVNNDLNTKVSGDYSAYRGQTSSVTFDLIQEPGPKTITRVRNHDMKLDESLSHIAIPDGYIQKEGNWMIYIMPYYIKYPGSCEEALEFKGCDVDIKWFSMKAYLYQQTTEY